MAEDTQTFEVQVLQLSGGMFGIGGLTAGDELQSLCIKISEKLQVPRAAIKLMLCGNTFTPEDSLQTLESLGISQGAELTYCRLSVLEVTSGARIVVREAGSDEFNGTYVGVPEDDFTKFIFSGNRGDFFFRKEGKEGKAEDQCICWYGADRNWPAGWYMEASRSTTIASYFIESSDMTCLPMSNWSPYKASTFSEPGMEPAPMLGSE